MPTLTSVHSRYNTLIGETTALADDTVGVSHINSAIKDILNRAQFNWSLATETLTLSSGVSNIATTFNRQLGIRDARIEGSSTSDDYIFTEIDVRKRDSYDTDDYVYWITLTAATGVYVFNSHTQSGSVVTYHNTIPADLTAGANICIVPDGEAVSYLAASKNWIGDERNLTLSKDFLQEAEKRIKAMIASDANFGPVETVGSALDSNPHLTGRQTQEFRTDV